ncbi:transposase [Streptomyces sp. NBC_01166]|uniref:transposase n=1 Tax=Streptomyces sp. NBC_01166 TaxID=2903755 RepID=UPI00386E5E90
MKVRADKAYYSAEHLRWLRSRNLIARIARPGIESGERLGRHRWKIERSISWLFGYRRLTVRYERKGSHFLAFLGLAAGRQHSTVGAVARGCADRRDNGGLVLLLRKLHDLDHPTRPRASGIVDSRPSCRAGL